MTEEKLVDKDLRKAFGTLVTWLYPMILGEGAVKLLLDMIQEPSAEGKEEENGKNNR